MMFAVLRSGAPEQAMRRGGLLALTLAGDVRDTAGRAVESRRRFGCVSAALAVAISMASCGDGGGGNVMVGGTAGEGRVSGSDQAQPSGWAAPIQADVWTTSLEAGSAVTILMCSTSPSSSFDPYLQLDFMGETVAMDDDSAGNLNARIVYTPARSGRYDIYAMSREGTAPAGGAAYSLRVLAGAMFDATCPMEAR